MKTAAKDIIDTGIAKFNEVYPRCFTFIKLLNEHVTLRPVVRGGFPLCEVKAEDGAAVRIVVYDNIVLDIPQPKSNVAYEDALPGHPWIKELKSDGLDEKWISANGSTERGKKRIVKSVELSVGKFLNTYIFGKDEDYYSENYSYTHTTNDVITALAPSDVKVAKDLETIRSVFARGEVTCMHPKSDSAKYWYGAEFQPVDWYHYCPDTEIAYIEVSNKIMVRATIINGTHCGRIYSPGGASFRKKFETWLGSKGIKFGGAGRGAAGRADLSSEPMVKLKTPFSIKAHKYKDKDVTPYPYTDYMVPLSVSYKDGYFHWGDKGQEVGLTNHGMIRAEDLANLVCARAGCGYRVRLGAGGGYIADDTGDAYCSIEHAPKTHIVVRRGADKLLIRKDTPGIIKDHYTGNFYYNLQSMVDAMPVIEFDNGMPIIPENFAEHDKWTTRAPAWFRYDGTKCGINERDLTTLGNNGMIDNYYNYIAPKRAVKVKTKMTKELVIEY